MDARLRAIERVYKREPTIQNYQLFVSALRAAGQPVFCYFCNAIEASDDGEIIFCDGGIQPHMLVGFCRDCGLNYVCGDPDCATGFECPSCLKKCSLCERTICPGHNARCESPEHEFQNLLYCIECTSHCGSCGKEYCTLHMGDQPFYDIIWENLCPDCQPDQTNLGQIFDT